MADYQSWVGKKIENIASGEEAIPTEYLDLGGTNPPFFAIKGNGVTWYSGCNNWELAEEKDKAVSIFLDYAQIIRGIDFILEQNTEWTHSTKDEKRASIWKSIQRTANKAIEIGDNEWTGADGYFIIAYWEAEDQIQVEMYVDASVGKTHPYKTLTLEELEEEAF